jgi:hypothetical protein
MLKVFGLLGLLNRDCFLAFQVFGEALDSKGLVDAGTTLAAPTNAALGN